MVVHQAARRFLFPSLTRGYLLRILSVGVVASLFFGYVCTPIRIKGSSMEPTYHNGGFNFCWRPGRLFSKLKRHDVVAIRFAGNRVMLLKRIVALEGEQVAFVDGKLFVNGKKMEEPYVRYRCDWNLPPRLVESGCVYVVGDNRAMPIEHHYFGQTSVKRVVGVPIW